MFFYKKYLVFIKYNLKQDKKKKKKKKGKYNNSNF